MNDIVGCFSHHKMHARSSPPQLVTVLLIKVLDNCSCDTGQSVAFVANNSEVVLCLQEDIYLFI